MPGESARHVLRHLSTLFHTGVAGTLTDAELLEHFVAGTEESADAAFAALVDRHGAMVLGVCRRVLGNRHAAEDAFQATFLVLARKAPEIARREQFASWLYGVARRAALDARARAFRQIANERRLRVPPAAKSSDETQSSELRSILDEELGRLPERHRTALILCELEGLSRREAAGRLGVSEGTLSSRLARAKLRLRDRLTRRGLALSVLSLTAALTKSSQGAVPPALIDSTIRIATIVATSCSLTGVASTSVVTLTQGVLKAMLLSKLKLSCLALLAAALLTTGAGVVAQDRPSDDDRLRNLERKVDRLLEVLGGSSRRTATTRPLPEPAAQPGEPASASPAQPGAPAAPPTAPIAAVPPVPGSAAILAPPAAPAPPAALVAAIPPLPQAPTAEMAPPARSGQSSLSHRIDMLEHRLAKLEQRLSAFEQRLNAVHSGGPHPTPAPRTSAPIEAVPGVAPPSATAPAPGGPAPISVLPPAPIGGASPAAAETPTASVEPVAASPPLAEASAAEPAAEPPAPTSPAPPREN